ncbi:MAG: flagellar basal body rod protein FlgB [Desulfobulbus propionicus]|nr:MAG: flagellar basal body rod protein FlgB [Desulfobulbus propionicus]
MADIRQTDTTIQLLSKVLDLRAKNQQVISSNIANAETPGYSVKSLEFEEQLQSALSDGSMQPVSTHPAHIPNAPASLSQVEGNLVYTRDKTGLGDENSVSVDQEMVKLSTNEILYETAVTMLKKKLSWIKYAINSGS